jgi:hypothetical protein
MPTVNVERAMSKLDPWTESARSVQEGMRKNDSSTLVLTDEQQSMLPAMKTTESRLLLEMATSVGSSNSKIESQRIRSKVRPGEVALEITDSQMLRLGLNCKATEPRKGYRPTPGLISLFSKTGTSCKNPKHRSRSTTPQNQTHPPPCRSYVDVIHNGMEGRG